MHAEELVETIEGRSFRKPDTAGGKINRGCSPKKTIATLTDCFKEETNQATFLGPFEIATRTRDVIHQSILHCS
jgi:hypothetical protein